MELWVGIIGLVVGGSFTLGAQALSNRSALARLEKEQQAAADRAADDRRHQSQSQLMAMANEFGRELGRLQAVADELGRFTDPAFRPFRSMDASKVDRLIGQIAIADAEVRSAGIALAIAAPSVPHRELLKLVLRDVARVHLGAAHKRLMGTAALSGMGLNEEVREAERGVARYTEWWSRSESDVSVYLVQQARDDRSDEVSAVREPVVDGQPMSDGRCSDDA